MLGGPRRVGPEGRDVDVCELGRIAGVRERRSPQHPLEARARDQRDPGRLLCLIVTRSEKDQIQAFKVTPGNEPLFLRVKNTREARIMETAVDAGALLPGGPDCAVVCEEGSERAVSFSRTPALLRVVRTRMPRGHVGRRSTEAPHPHHGSYDDEEPAPPEAPTPFELEEVPALEARWFIRECLGTMSLWRAGVKALALERGTQRRSPRMRRAVPWTPERAASQKSPPPRACAGAARTPS